MGVQVDVADARPLMQRLVQPQVRNCARLWHSYALSLTSLGQEEEAWRRRKWSHELILPPPPIFQWL